MKLSIILPAYNEEKSIYNIGKKCLDSSFDIIQNTFVDEIEILIINDGSTDNTKNIADSIDGIKLVNHKINCGYGAALKTGFNNSNGEIIGFLDADETWNPIYFIQLLNELNKADADICIASRMHKNSKMPKIRRIGNKLFASTINIISGTNISDSSSGFRVFKRNALYKLIQFLVLNIKILYHLL